MVNELLTERQKDAIIKCFQERSKLIQQKERWNALYFPQLGNTVYEKGRKKHTITSEIYAAFPHGMKFEDIVITAELYGSKRIGLHLPQLNTPTAIIQIYNISSRHGRKTTQEIKKKCRKCRKLKQPRRFGLLYFTLSKTFELSKLELIELDQDAKPINATILYQQPKKK